MSSFGLSSSSSFPPSVPLAHSLNSRGELGMYVNPYACPCATCVDYIAERAPEGPPIAHEEPRADDDGDGSSAPALARAPANHVMIDGEWVHQDSPEGRIYCELLPESSSTRMETQRFPPLTRSVGFSNVAPETPALSSSVLPTRSLGGGIGLLRGGPGISVSLAPPRPLARSTGAYSPVGLTRTDTSYVEGWGGEERPLFFGASATGAGAGGSSNPRGRPAEHEEEFCDTLRSYRATLQCMSTADVSDEVLSERDRKIRAIEDCLLAFRSFFRTG